MRKAEQPGELFCSWSAEPDGVQNRGKVCSRTCRTVRHVYNRSATRLAGSAPGLQHGMARSTGGLPRQVGAYAAASVTLPVS